MKKPLLLAFACISMTIVTNAQAPVKPLKKVMELKMPKTEDDDMPGTRGASVAWHPTQKKYYACFAGNVEYPLAVFDATGKRLSDDELTTMADTRGIWYNETTKLLGGNGYNDFGWFNYKLDNKGMPSDVEVTNEGMHQPDVQSVGAYSSATKQVIFVLASQVYFYNKDAELQDSIMIHWGHRKADGIDEDEDASEQPEDYNYTTLVYTGIKGQELGFLNITNKQVELYDVKSGFLTKILSLPETTKTELLFNFAYANGTYWLFNIEMRKWVGYK